MACGFGQPVIVVYRKEACPASIASVEHSPWHRNSPTASANFGSSFALDDQTSAN